VTTDHLLGDRPHQVHVALRIDAVTSYGGAHLGVELVDQGGVEAGRGGRGDRHGRLRSSRDDSAIQTCAE
jgi:hypothetical protein